MSINIAAGAMGSMWFIVCSPQPIFNVFLRNVLGISSTELGLLLTVTQFMAAFQLVSIFIFAALKRRKPFVILAHIVQRVYAFVLAGAAFWAQSGAAAGNPRGPAGAFPFIFGAMSLAWVAWNACSSGWWSWVADIFPDAIRGSFFGRRSAVINAVNIVWFFLVTLALDWIPDGYAFMAYGIVFLVGGTVGVADLLLHILIPEPPQERNSSFSMGDFLAPLRDRNYLGFVLAIGLSLFSINVFAPFIGPYTTSPDGVGAPNTWLGISYALSQLAWIAAAPIMGIMMDRYGRKPVVILGLLSVLNWVGYFFISGRNYAFLIPAMSLFSGFLASGFWEGQNQMMLSLTPEKNRTAYVSWYLALTGMIASMGPYAGGFLYDRLSGLELSPLPGIHIGPFQIVMAISLALTLLSILALSKINEARGRPFGYVFSRLANPEFFRTVLNLNIISGSTESERTVRALRMVDGPTSDIALTEVLGRAKDLDMEVRIEAVRALGRIRSKTTAPVLLSLLDESSMLRCEAALALGKLGLPSALPRLMEGLSSDSTDFQEACARAIGLTCQACAREEGPGLESPIAKALFDLFLNSGEETVAASAAEAVSRMGDVDAAVDIYPRYHSAIDPRLRRELAVALGNLVGRPGEFYQFLSGDPSGKRSRLQRLGQEAARNARLCAASTAATPEARQAMETSIAGIADAIEEGTHAKLLKAVVETGQALLSFIPLKAFSSGAAAGHREDRIALLRWFMDELELIAARHGSDCELQELDALLGLYALARFEP
jgi:HEAT repeat protein